MPIEKNCLIILTTCADENTAKNIAHELVDQKIAACVNIVPRIISCFRWEGKVEVTDEFLLLIKTSSDRYTKVETCIKAIHTYELPEIIAMAISEGSTDYLRWITDSTAVS